MKRIIIAAVAALALGAGAATASAVPTIVKAPYQSGDRLYVPFNYDLPDSATYNPDFYASVWTSTAPHRRVRALGRHNINSEYGFNTASFHFNYINYLRAGTYYACIRGVVRLDSGAVSAHNSCHRFFLRHTSTYDESYD